MAWFETWFKNDLAKPINVVQLQGVMFNLDNLANKIGVELEYNGQPAALEGTIAGYVIRNDGTTLNLTTNTGKDGNKAWVILPQEAYTVEGPISIVIKLVYNSAETTIGACAGYVTRSRTSSEIAPTGTVIPSLASLEAAIAAANAAAANAAEAADYIAPTEEDSTASAAHAVGSYFIYNGKLMKATSAIAQGATIVPYASGVTNYNCAEETGGLAAPVATNKALAMEGISKAGIVGTWTAPAESGTIATSAHAVGNYFTYNGYLYRATTAIAQGATIVTTGENANCALVPGGLSSAVLENHNEIGLTAADIATVETRYNESVSTASAAHAKGSYFILGGVLYKATADIAIGDTIVTTGTGANASQVPGGAMGEVADLKSAFSDYQNAISEYKKPTNLYNKNSNLNHNDVRVSASGNFNTLSGSSVSHPIKIDKTKSYVFKFSTSFYGTAANRIVRRCDANGNLVDLDAGFVNAEIVDNAYGRIKASLWESRPQWEYFCVNVRTSDKVVMIIAEGSTLPEYSNWFEPYTKIKPEVLPDNLPVPANAQLNQLYNKKIAFTGDSICYGAGYVGGYPKIIGENNNMTVANSGQTGATLASGTTAEGSNRGWICRKVANMPTGYDYYIVEGGVNDFALTVPLGTMTNGYTDSLDDTTVLGALESICKTLQTSFKGKKYGFVFTHKCYANTSSYITTWIPAMKKVLEKWGIPYIDLGEKTAQLYNIDSLRIYTSSGDGWHPTEEGYRLFYVDKIEAWLKTL